MPPAHGITRTRRKRRPKVVTKAQYKNDGQGYTLDTWSHLFIVAAEGGEIRQITDGNWDDFAPAWSPDGRQIAFNRKQEDVEDLNASRIWVVNANGGSARQITQNVYHATSASWSPDGSTLAFYGANEKRLGLEESLYRVWTAPVSGGTPQPLNADYDRGVLLLTRPAVTPGPVWSPDSATVTFSIADQGNIHLVRASVRDGKMSSVVTGERQVTAYSAAPGVGRLAFCAVDPYNPGDIYVCAWDGSKEQRLTWVNESIFEHLSMPSIEKRTFRSPHGALLDGWLMRPVSGEGPMPLLLDIHGGPHGFVGNYFSLSHFYRYTLASKGWVVLALNPSGSGSYGEAFANSICGRWGEFDMPEQLAAIDELVAEGIADPDRLAVAGYSYGGYMSAWMIGQSDRFKAAVVGAPIVNLESFHGTSDIGMWFCSWEMKGDIISNRERFRRLSPANYVERITTPTLILHGEADERCPISQGEELYIGLLTAGRVPVEFIRYPESSHLFLSSGCPSHRVDYHRRVGSWLEYYVNSSQFEGKQNGE
jgi:dipeptidyl aminopeptidase/acylaminoacyl peptidase